MPILVVDDELSMREYLDVLLSKGGHQVRTASNVAEALVALEDGTVDLVLSDMRLGKESGLAVLRAARRLPLPPEVILVTAYGTPAAAVDAMREGAYDYICKPFDNEELRLLTQKALEKRELLLENLQLRKTTPLAPGGVFVGSGARMRDIWALVQKVAGSRSTVLITGESGTGKELIARGIHWRGPRRGQAFVPVNCAALAENLLESELFGHVKGAFTGATSDRPGILVSAGEGTVLLDEVGEIPLSTQVKLLRVLQERKVKPVGSAAEISFQARVIAATNKKLDHEVKEGRFREDLFYRLNVITIEVPPLRERAEDVLELTRFFLGRMADELGRPNLLLTPPALDLLQHYAFPGNVRQLQNIIERAATLAETDVLGPETLPDVVRGEVARDDSAVPVTLSDGFSLERFLDDAERRYLLSALDRAGGVKTKAAALLGLSFRSFRYRLAKQGLAAGEDVS